MISSVEVFPLHVSIGSIAITRHFDERVPFNLDGASRGLHFSPVQLGELGALARCRGTFCAPRESISSAIGKVTSHPSSVFVAPPARRSSGHARIKLRLSSNMARMASRRSPLRSCRAARSASTFRTRPVGRCSRWRGIAKLESILNPLPGSSATRTVWLGLAARDRLALRTGDLGSTTGCWGA